MEGLKLVECPGTSFPPHGAHLGYGRIDSLRVGGQVGPRAPKRNVHRVSHSVHVICSPLAAAQSSGTQRRGLLCCRVVGVHEVGP